MKFHGPAAVLLGGVLLCSSTGCSIAGALFTDFRPTTAPPLKSSDRMLVIGKVFEQQGRTERARALYRAALKQNPADVEARRLLAGLGPAPQPAVPATAPMLHQQTLVAESKVTPPATSVRVNELLENLPGTESPAEVAQQESTPALSASFSRTESAEDTDIAALTGAGAEAVDKVADALPEPGPAAESALVDVETVIEAAPLELTFPEPTDVESVPESATTDAAELLELSGVFAATEDGQSEVEIIEVPASAASADAALFEAPAAAFPEAVGKAVAAPPAELVFPELPPTEPAAPAAPVEEFVPEADESAAEASLSSAAAVDHVLTLAASADEHSEELIEVLLTSDSMEARCLAAALLGECSQDDYRAGDALKQVAETTEDESLLLAAADSQLNRREMGPAVARRLIGILPDAVPAVQVQLITMLRNFHNTECDAESAAALKSMLTATDDQVRTAVVLTLADFSSVTADCMEQIRDIEANDASEMVRSAAGISLARMESNAAQSR